MKNIVIILFLATFAFRMWQTTGCRNFISFVFNPQTIKISVEEQTHVDTQTQNLTSRFFHNKLSSGVFEVSKSYAKFFEPLFIIEQVGPFGLILFILALSYTIKNPTKLQLSHLAVVAAAPFFVIFTSNSKLSFFLMSIAVASFSTLGFKAFRNNRQLMLIALLLTVINIWYFAFSWQMQIICNEIFFH